MVQYNVSTDVTWKLCRGTKIVLLAFQLHVQHHVIACDILTLVVTMQQFNYWNASRLSLHGLLETSRRFFSYSYACLDKLCSSVVVQYLYVNLKTDPINFSHVITEWHTLKKIKPMSDCIRPCLHYAYLPWYIAKTYKYLSLLVLSVQTQCAERVFDGDQSEEKLIRRRKCVNI